MTVKTHLSKLSESNGDVSTRSQSKKCGDKKYVKHLKELPKKQKKNGLFSIRIASAFFLKDKVFLRTKIWIFFVFLA